MAAITVSSLTPQPMTPDCTISSRSAAYEPSSAAVGAGGRVLSGVGSAAWLSLVATEVGGDEMGLESVAGLSSSPQATNNAISNVASKAASNFARNANAKSRNRRDRRRTDYIVIDFLKSETGFS